MSKFNIYLLSLSIICYPLKLFSQCLIKGFVNDKQTGQPIANTPITYKKTKNGISANENGFFELKTTCPIKDTFVISAINYITKEIILDTTSKDLFISLLKIEKELKRVVIKQTKKKETIVLNEIDKCSANYYVSSESVHQIAQSFDNPFLSAKIKGIEMCKLKDNSFFRIRFYEYDSFTL